MLLNISIQLCLIDITVCLALFFLTLGICYLPSTRNACIRAQRTSQPAPRDSVLCCKLQHLKHQCDNDTETTCTCHKSRAVIKRIECCIIRTIFSLNCSFEHYQQDKEIKQHTHGYNSCIKDAADMYEFLIIP